MTSSHQSEQRPPERQASAQHPPDQQQPEQQLAARSQQETRLKRNFAHFEGYLQRAETYLARNQLAAAVVHTTIASHIAVQNHAGLFWSPRAERLLSEVGKRIGPPLPAMARPTTFTRVLQVGTQMAAVGGLTKMLCQWVNVDSARQHTLVLTQQTGPIPQFVRESFAKSGAGVQLLNHTPGGHIEWALRLRQIARDYDLVILHTHCEDPVPLLAFARPGEHPPILLLNHADHLFWFGPSICDLAINLRDAAQDLAIARRGIAPQRNILMPTLAEAVTRTRTREEAKRELGIADDRILMVSVARRLKYKTMHGVTFADLHADILDKHANAMLLVVGAGDPEDWAPLRERFGDRLRSTPELPNPKIYFEAADIYVDSFPFVSSTSLMEAAGYGVPTATIFTYPDETRIFGINHVALVGNVRQATSFAHYTQILDEFVSDADLRARLAVTSRAAVAKEHNMPGWQRWLEAVYARAGELPELDNTEMLQRDEHAQYGEPDWRHEDIFGGDWPTAQVIKSYMGTLPLHQRIAHWRELRDAGVFASPTAAAAHVLLPEWLKRYVKDKLFVHQ